MSGKAFQDTTSTTLPSATGAVRLNADGLQIKTFWEGEESVTRYRPASLPHRHSRIRLRWAHRIAGRLPRNRHRCCGRLPRRRPPMDSNPPLRYVTDPARGLTSSPRRFDGELELRGRVKENSKAALVVVRDDRLCRRGATARGEVVAVQMPKTSSAAEPISRPCGATRGRSRTEDRVERAASQQARGQRHQPDIPERGVWSDERQAEQAQPSSTRSTRSTRCSFSQANVTWHPPWSGQRHVAMTLRHVRATPQPKGFTRTQINEAGSHRQVMNFTFPACFSLVR